MPRPSVLGIYIRSDIPIVVKSADEIPGIGDVAENEGDCLSYSGLKLMGILRAGSFVISLGANSRGS